MSPAFLDSGGVIRATRNADAQRPRIRVPAGPEAGAGEGEGRDGALNRRAACLSPRGRVKGEGALDPPWV